MRALSLAPRASFPSLRARAAVRFRTVVGGGLASYATTFPDTENPLSEGGRWINGLAVGLEWQDMQTGSGNCYASAINPDGFRDNAAHLIGYAPDHYIEGVVHKAGGYAPTDVHELEFLLRAICTANSFKAYEVLMDTAGNFQYVRWNGPYNDFTFSVFTDGSGAGPGTIAHDDVIRAMMVGDWLTLFKNGSQVYTARDVTAGKLTTGNPGIGSYMRGNGNVLSSFGWQSIVAGNL